MAMGHFIEIHNLFSISHASLVGQITMKNAEIWSQEELVDPPLWKNAALSTSQQMNCLPNISKTHQKSNSQNNPEAVSSALRGVSPTLSLGRWWNSRWSRMKPWSAGPCQNSLKFTVIITIILDHTSLQLLFLTPSHGGWFFWCIGVRGRPHERDNSHSTPYKYRS